MEHMGFLLIVLAVIVATIGVVIAVLQEPDAKNHGQGEPTRVVVTDISMSFRSMVWLMVKWGVASLPAVIILAIVGFALSIPATVGVGVLVRLLYLGH